MDIIDHRRHIEEIEAKLGKTTITASTKTIEAIGRILSPGEANFEIDDDDEEQSDLEIMKKNLKDNFVKKENYLDAICDEITKQSPLKTQDTKAQKKITKKDIDPQKKTKLLAALKAIDGHEDSFEK